MELDPAYCDVIVRRYEAVTGKTAERQPGNGAGETNGSPTLATFGVGGGR
jgi:hypothetical protein